MGIFGGASGERRFTLTPTPTEKKAATAQRPVLADLKLDRRERPFGVSRKFQYKMTILLGVLGLTAIVAFTPLMSWFGEAGSNLKPQRPAPARATAGAPASYPLVRDPGDPSDPNATDVQLPSAARPPVPQSGDNLPAAGAPPGDNQPADNTPGAAPAVPAPRGGTQAPEAAPGQPAPLKPRVVSETEFPPDVSTYRDNRTDVKERPYSALHETLLRATETLGADAIRAAANLRPPPQARLSAAEIRNLRGRVFTVEGTVHSIARVPVAPYGLDNSFLGPDGKPRRFIYQVLISYAYSEVEESVSGAFRPVFKSACVYVTSLERPVIDQRDRVRVRGIYFRVSPFRDGDQFDYYPHLVSRPELFDQLESPPLIIHPAILASVDDSTTTAMRGFPTLAIQELLDYVSRLSNDQRKALITEAKRSQTPITYGDVMREPQVYRQVNPALGHPPVVRFLGQVARVARDGGVFTEWNFKPNPYGLVHGQYGVMHILDERGNQQLIAYDAAWDGETQPKGLAINDEVELYGFFVWKWSYQDTKGNRQVVPRFVVISLKKLPPQTDPIGGFKWVFVIAMTVVLALLFVLLRRESAEVRSFRELYGTNSLRKLDPSAFERVRKKRREQRAALAAAAGAKPDADGKSDSESKPDADATTDADANDEPDTTPEASAEPPTDTASSSKPDATPGDAEPGAAANGEGG